MSALVDSTMLYGVKIWGCMRSLETIEQVQLRPFRMFIGVGSLHSKASLMMEMESLPVVWEARMRYVQLLSVAWRNVRDEWRKEMHEKLKLSMMKRIMECEVKSSCAFLKSTVERRMMLKFRGETAAFQIEVGRWHGLKREERVCKGVTVGRLRMCATGYCSALRGIPFRRPFVKAMNGVGEDFLTKGNGDRTALILSHACIGTIT